MLTSLLRVSRKPSRLVNFWKRTDLSLISLTLQSWSALSKPTTPSLRKWDHSGFLTTRVTDSMSATTVTFKDSTRPRLLKSTVRSKSSSGDVPTIFLPLLLILVMKDIQALIAGMEHSHLRCYLPLSLWLLLSTVCYHTGMILFAHRWRKARKSL